MEERQPHRKLFAGGEMGNGPESLMACGCGTTGEGLSNQGIR